MTIPAYGGASHSSNTICCGAGGRIWPDPEATLAHRRVRLLGCSCRANTGRTSGAPRATMIEDHDRRVRPCGPVDVHLLGFGRPIGDAIGVADDGKSLLAVRRVPLADAAGIEGIDALVIGVVEFLL